jgi:hypothetical protein
MSMEEGRVEAMKIAAAGVEQDRVTHGMNMMHDKTNNPS